MFGPELERAVAMRTNRKISRWLPMALSIGVVLSLALRAQGDGESREQAVLTTIGKILPDGHLSHHSLDDEISRRALDDFVQALDPMKLYFLKSDVETLARSKDRLDDMVRAGDDSFAKG